MLPAAGRVRPAVSVDAILSDSRGLLEARVTDFRRATFGLCDALCVEEALEGGVEVAVGVTRGDRVGLLEEVYAVAVHGGVAQSGDELRHGHRAELLFAGLGEWYELELGVEIGARPYGGLLVDDVPAVVMDDVAGLVAGRHERVATPEIILVGSECEEVVVDVARAVAVDGDEPLLLLGREQGVAIRSTYGFGMRHVVTSYDCVEAVSSGTKGFVTVVNHSVPKLVRSSPVL